MDRDRSLKEESPALTAGVGENQPQIRAAVCEQLAWPGVGIDAAANARNDAKISTASSRVAAFVIPTDEQWVIADEAHDVLKLVHDRALIDLAGSLAKYAGAQELGISADQVRLVIVHNRRHSEDHMVTAVHQDGEWLILDNLTDVVLRDWEKVDYEPLAVLDYKGARRYLSAFWME